MCHEREKLIAYVYEECAPAEKQAIDAHLESCTECRDEIRDLRRVRQDLLAWDVPAHESVWRPFAPAQTVAWWRQVPAWAMAAAAGVMFVCGLAGGAVGHAVFTQDVSAMAASDLAGANGGVEANASVLPASFVSSDELTAAEQRILAMLRADLARVERRARQSADFDRIVDEVTMLRARVDHGELQGDVLRRTLQDLSERARRVESGLGATNSAVEQLMDNFLNSGSGGGGR